VGPINTTLNEIIAEKDRLVSIFQNVLNNISAVPVMGPLLEEGISCMLPITAFNFVDTAVDLMVSFIQDIFDLQVRCPRFIFPNLAPMAVSSTHTAITFMVTQIQSELRRFQIIFIFLTISFGILVFQGVFFVSMKKLHSRWMKRRRVSVHA